MTPDHEPTLGQSIGGRWAISWITWAVLAVGSLGTVFTGIQGATGALMMVWVAGIAAMGLAFWAAHVTVLRHRAVRPVPVAVVVGVAVLAGLARAAAVEGAAHAAGVHVIRAWPATAAANVVLIVVVTVGLAPVLDQLTRHRARRATLEARLAALRQEDAERTGLTDALTRAAQDELLSALDDARVHLDGPVGEAGPADRAEMATRLRDVVDTTLRPLSHRLYAAGAVDAAPARNRMSWAAFDTLPVLPLATTALVVVVLLPSSTRPLAAPVAAVATWLVLSLVAAAARRWSWVRAHEMVAGAAALLIGWEAVALSVGGVVDLSVSVALVSAVISIILLVIAGVVVEVMRGGEEFNQRLAAQVSAREVEAAAANREVARASRDLAQYVHGTLQSRLLAIAFAIERAAQSGDDAAFRAAVHDARAALDEVGAPTGPPRDMREALDGVAALWAGFIDVQIDVAPAAAALPGAAAADVTRVVGEAVANARKHGRARRAWVRVDAVPTGVSVCVDDDGQGPAPAPVGGMGSAWLDFIAPGAWTLVARGDGGARLQVLLPATATVAPQHAAEAAR